MIQNVVALFKDDTQINNRIAEIEACKYCTVTDVRILNRFDLTYGIQAQIIYNYDISQYIADTSQKE